jgi:hypothetical protein
MTTTIPAATARPTSASEHELIPLLLLSVPGRTSTAGARQR